jgi:serine/threonine protein kinase
MDMHTGKMYVQKSISAMADARVLKGFRNEVDLLSKLGKEQVPELVEVYEEKNCLCMVESWIEGKSVKEWMQTKPDFKKRLDVFEQYLRFLQRIHAAGYLYVVIKPEHLLISEEKLYVIDFNGITPIGSHTLLMASYKWSAPELEDNQSKKEAFDVYGAGCLMDYLQLNRGSLKKIRNKALQKVTERYENAASLQNALQYWKKKTAWLKRAAALLILSAGIACAMTFVPAGKAPSALGQGMANAALFEEQKEEYESSERLFYAWIDQGYLNEALLQDEQTAFYFVFEAIESANPLICSYMLDLLPDVWQQKNPEWSAMLSILGQRKEILADNWLASCISSIQTKANVNESFNLILRFALSAQMYLGMDEEIFALMESCADAQTISLYLSYLLMLQSRRDCTLSFDEAWLDAADENGLALYELYKQSQSF